MKPYLLMGTAVVALAALAAPAQAHDGCETRRNRAVIRRVQAAHQVTYASYGRCEPRRTVRVYRSYPRVSHDRLNDRIERAHYRAHVRGFRTREEHRRLHDRLDRQRDRAERLRVRRVGWGSDDPYCR